MIQEEKMYFRLKTSEDGEVYLTTYQNQEDLLKEIEDEIKDYKLEFHPNFTKSLNGTEDLTSGHFDIIIKGDIVVPKPKKVVESYQID